MCNLIFHIKLHSGRNSYLKRLENKSLHCIIEVYNCIYSYIIYIALILIKMFLYFYTYTTLNKLL